MKNKLAKNSLAVGVVTLIVTAGLSFSANGASDPVSQASSSAVKGTGLFQILDGGFCAAAVPDPADKGRCGAGLPLTGIPVYNQDATATNSGNSTAHANIAGTDLTGLGPALDITDLVKNLGLIDTQTILDPVIGKIVDPVLKTLVENLLKPLITPIDDALNKLLAGLQTSLPISLKTGAVDAQCSATPTSADGNSTVADLHLTISLGGQAIDVPIKLPTAPNSDLLISDAAADSAAQQLVNDILISVQDTLTKSFGGQLAGLNLIIKGLQDQVVNTILNAIKTPLLNPLGQAIKPILSGKVNGQVVGPKSKEITALHLAVLTSNVIDIGEVKCGPNAGPAKADDTNAQADTQADTNADTQADTNADNQADVDTQADADAAADSDAQADADVTTTLPGTGAPNLTPFWLLGMGLLLFGATVLINEKRRFAKQ